MIVEVFLIKHYKHFNCHRMSKQINRENRLSEHALESRLKCVVFIKLVNLPTATISVDDKLRHKSHNFCFLVTTHILNNILPMSFVNTFSQSHIFKLNT